MGWWARQTSVVAQEPLVSDPVGGSQGRLRTYIRLNLVVVLVATGWLVGLRVWVVRSHWIELLILLLAGMSGCFLLATAMLNRRRHVAAVVTVAMSTWALTLAAAVITPFALAILPLCVLLPTLLAVQHLNRPQLAALLGATVAVAMLLAPVARLGTGVGLEEQVPGWVLDFFVIEFVPVTVGLFSVLAWQAHEALLAKTEALQDSRMRLVMATDRERRRIERNLHDGAQQRLVTAAVQARVAQRLLVDQPEQARTQLDELTQDLQDAAAELRDLAHGIYPPQLTDHGLEAALRTAALQSPLPTTVHANGIGRYPVELEVNVFFCCLEALQNASKHAGETATVTITLADRDGLSFDVQDTGVGCQPTAILTGYGFANMRDRLDAIGGILTIDTGPGIGVHLHGELPRDSLNEVAWAQARRWRSAISHGLAGFWAVAGRAWGKIRYEATEEQRAVASLRALLGVAWVTVVFDLVVYAVLRDPSFLFLGVASAVVALFYVGAVRDAEGNRVGYAVVALAIAFWAYPLLQTLLIPVTLQYAPLVIVVPVIVAAPLVPRERFRSIIAVTVMVAVALAFAGRVLPSVGIEEQAPDWFLDLAVIELIVLGTALVGFLIWQAHGALLAKTEALQDSRVRLVMATDRERRRIERNLHDGAQQRLVTAAVQARVAQRLLPDQPEQAQALLNQLIQDLQDAATELLDLAHGIYPAQLTDHGLKTALWTAAVRSPLPTTVQAIGIGRYPPELEANVYFCCLEALQNACKHAGAGATVIMTLVDRDGLSFDVQDTGVGCQPTAILTGHGFANMRDRLDAIGGTLIVHTRPGAGVHLQGQVPNHGSSR